MKICLISFDHWQYDAHIVDALRAKGVDAYHINIGQYKHPSKLSRLKNTLCKVFLGKNPKIALRQKFILDQLDKIGFQDQIMVINPELIDREYHLKIKKCTKRYIAYLYDSLERHPIGSLIEGVFDDIYSFDKSDIKTNNFKEVSNYIYLQHPKEQLLTPRFDVCYLASFDGRISAMNRIAHELDRLKKSYQFVIVGKKTWLKKVVKLGNINSSIHYQIKRIKHEEIPNYYSDAAVVLDLVRCNQSGLSFRVFEAMALEKKLITDNQNIKCYDFYNPNNILVLNAEYNNITREFLETPYNKIPKVIYHQYTLDSWVTNVFELN
jgi:glycosyltransferase involved in cell wall biosynthesis